MSKIEEKIENLLKKRIESLNYELYDVEFSKEGKEYFLRIFIDKENGVNIEDCEIVTNAISDLLDEADYIKEQYFLEVSSPGIERVLRKDQHLKQNNGKEIEIKLFKKDEEGNKKYIGKLKGFDEDTIIVDFGDEIKYFKRENIAHIKTVYNW